MLSGRKLGLKATIDRRSGFCFGVVKAIQKAETLLDEGQTVYCVGQIVHNDEEVNRLKKKGLVTIDHQEMTALSGANILFRAHGEPPASYETARKNNNILMDATCPIVLKLQRDVKKAWQEGDHVFIFGKHRHPETIGLAGQTDGEAVVFNSLEELKKLELPGRITLFSQTTMSPEVFQQVVQYLEGMGVEVDLHDTICRQVSGRDQELKMFSRRHDRVIFLAGRHSSNGRMLYEVCRSHNPNTHFASTAEEIQRDWFREGESVGICGATSTPLWLLKKAKEKIESL